MTPSEISLLTKNLSRASLASKNSKRYLNIPCSFDIETTSFEYRGEKRATMYVWCLNIDGFKIIGRTWYEYMKTITEISKIIPNTILIIYIHNLGYEFQFMRRWLDVRDVFSIDLRKPIYVKTPNIEYRCSYLLTGLSLEKWGEKLKLPKLVGSVDYNIKRHSQTILTEEDYNYVMRDTDVVVEGIRQEIKDNGDISKIPYTKTGYVRRACRESTIKIDENYRRLVQNMTMTVDEYKLVHHAFAGGHTHANALYVEETCENIMSKDETSAYPFVLCTCEFPSSSGVYVKNPTYDDVLGLIKRNRACVFEVKFKNIMVKVDFESIISKHKCITEGETIVNNGRVWFAETLYTTITDVDLDNISNFYSWESIEIGDLYWYYKKLLPRCFVLSILEFYKDKTVLKGVEGQEVFYMKQKENANSCYGMCVTNIIRDKIVYEDEWSKDKPDEQKDISYYNNDKKRFLSYIWGVYVTAYARQNLYKAILEVKEDYRYSDTDSVKYANHESHEKWFEDYNSKVIEKLHTISKKQNIPFEYFSPKNIYGEDKPLGVWETDGVYDRFKTLGAKRYAYEQDGKFKTTIAGLSKSKGSEYIERMGGFDFFKDNMQIPEEETGKLTHTYIDEPFRCPLTDYNGVTMVVGERSCIHLGGCSYDMSLSGKFKQFLKEVKQ